MIKKYVLNLAEVVEKSIMKMLPDKLALLFDGWTEGSFHYIGVFAFFNNSIGKGNQVLLAFLVLANGEDYINDPDLSVEIHVGFLQTTLEDD